VVVSSNDQPHVPVLKLGVAWELIQNMVMPCSTANELNRPHQLSAGERIPLKYGSEVSGR